MARTIALGVFTALLNLTTAMASDRPNIVYILADDMGPGDIQALNKACQFPIP